MIQFAFILFHSEVVASTQEKKYTLFKTTLSTHSLTLNLTQLMCMLIFLELPRLLSLTIFD